MRGFVALFVLFLFGNLHLLPLSAQTCLPTRLAIGDDAQVTPGAANRIRAQSDTDSEQIGQIPAGEVATILDGPECVGGFLWWNVNYNNTRGWTVEASSSDYFLEPYTEVIETPASVVESCTVPTRLQVNGYGQVSSTVPSRLRNAPGVNGEQVGQVELSNIFKVVDGPICSDNFNWWQVEVNGLLGWLAEGDAQSYYVEAVSDSTVAALTITPEPTIITYAISWNADNSRVAIATSTGIWLYNPSDWTQDPKILDNGILATDIAFSPTDPDLLVINGNELSYRFRVYDLRDDGDSMIVEQALMDGPMGGERPAVGFAFSTDGSLLAFGGSSFEIFDTDNWTRVNHLAIYEAAGNHYVSAYILPAALNISGDYGAGAVDSDMVGLFDFTIPHSSSFGTADPRISTLDRGGRTESISALQFSPDGPQVIIGDITGSLQMWDIETGERSSFIRGDDATSISNRINDIAFHPEGDMIATAESEPRGILRFFATDGLEQLSVFVSDEVHTTATVIAYSPDGTTLLAVLDDRIYLLDTVDYNVQSQIPIRQP